MLSRTVPRVRNVRSTAFTRSPVLRRRIATDSDKAGHSTYDTTTSAHKGNGEEAIPTWIYISTGSLLSLWLFWSYIQPSSTNPLTRFLSISDAETKSVEEKSARHLKFVEQAAQDKHLFMSTSTSPTVDVKFPERVGVHSPYFNTAGWTRGRLMDELEAHLQKENPKK